MAERGVIAAVLGIRPALIFRWQKQQRDKEHGQTATWATRMHSALTLI